MIVWCVWDPQTNITEQRTQRARPREHARAVVVDHWLARDPIPSGGNAREWDAWRGRHGYAGGHS